MKNKLQLIFTMLVGYLMHSQTEYLVTVDPSNCDFEIVNDIPDINFVAIFPNYTTFDEINKRYILKGKDFSGNTKLYTIDANTGEMLFNPPFPVPDDVNDNLVELQYDNTGNQLYALHWKYDEETEYLVSLNLETGEYSLINSLPVAEPVSVVPPFTYRRFSTFDKAQRNYIFSGADLDGNKKLFTVDAVTGIILSSPDFPQLLDSSDVILELQFDNATGNLYAIYLDYSEAEFYIVSINQQTGQHTIVCPIPNLLTVNCTNGYSVFDENQQTFILNGMDSTGWKLFSVHLGSGVTTTTSFFPQVGLFDNVIELQMDNASKTLYGLHWKNNNLGVEQNEKDNAILFPNPASKSFSIILDRTYSEIEVQIFNMIGQKVKWELISNANTVTLDISEIPVGTYAVEILNGGKFISQKKLIIK